MGVDPTLIASTLNCVVAQRLARRLCVHCRKPDTATAEQLGPTRLMADQNVLTLYSAVGCPKCQGTGYAGRVALREVLPVQGEVRTLIERSTEEIFAAAVRGRGDRPRHRHPPDLTPLPTGMPVLASPV
jgi:type II secretory ATPase GspE/PulE/Tfp pilus assembly ATPase PilB-like protein